MLQETIKVPKSNGGSASFSKLFVGLPAMSPFDWCDVVVGFPGQPPVKQRMSVGDAVLYETTQDGILEVRASAIHGSGADFTVTQVSPRPGFGAALVSEDPNNSPFTDEERARIRSSVEEVKSKLESAGKHSDEQLSLISRKLDEIHMASGRLGRKDWLNYVAGSLTGLCVSAAFSPEVTKSFFQTVSSAFSWVFTSAPALLQFGGVA